MYHTFESQLENKIISIETKKETMYEAICIAIQIPRERLPFLEVLRI